MESWISCAFGRSSLSSVSRISNRFAASSKGTASWGRPSSCRSVHSSKLILDEGLREIAVGQHVLVAAAPVPGISQVERQRGLVAKLVEGVDLLAAADELEFRAGRDALHVLREDQGRVDADVRQH